ncbi:hypothetical protein JCM15765_25930 [Paradesulfitobacterium aromaticivorans]
MERLAELPLPVMITGENGTGKKHAAARLHYGGKRRARPFLMTNSLEFGWDSWNRKLLAAYGGTLVLTNADQLPLETLHQVLLSGRDVRIILTANELQEFSGVERLHLPALRERTEDIPVLVREFLIRAGVNNPEAAISSEALRRLMLYPFLQGNVEELAKVIQEAVILAGDSVIRPEHLRLGRYKARSSRPLVGLALGGGAVRGSAHVGVLKVLERESIPVDFIAGTSVGSLIGALYCAGVTVAELENLMSHIRWKDLVRWTWPREALVDNKPLAEWLERRIGPKNFADLKIPFAAVASDATTGAGVILKTGSVAEAVRASTAIPFLMRPVRYADRTLIDGGVVHKVPVALARSMGADVVIAINVGLPKFTLGPARNLIDALLHAFDMMSERLVADEMELADIVLQPRSPVSGYSFKNAKAFSRIGEEAAEKAVKKIRQCMVQIYGN